MCCPSDNLLSFWAAHSMLTEPRVGKEQNEVGGQPWPSGTMLYLQGTGMFIDVYCHNMSSVHNLCWLMITWGIVLPSISWGF